MNNLLAIAISFVYVLLILGIAEGLRRALRLEVEFTRKFVHIGVGMWSIGTVLLFTDKWAALIPPFAFVLLNYLSYRYGLFMAMESKDKSNLGTVYFPIAFVVMILLLFDRSRSLFVASLMPMTWGDSFAAIVGKRFGRHRYTVLGTTRSLEGSLAMFVLSLVSTWITLTAFGAGAAQPLTGVFAVLMAGAATLAEAVCPFGLDNLLVPAASVLGMGAGLLIAAAFVPMG